MAYVTVNVDLDEFETDDLIYEIEKRGHEVDGDIEPDDYEITSFLTNYVELIKMGKAKEAQEYLYLAIYTKTGMII